MKTLLFIILKQSVKDDGECDAWKTRVLAELWETKPDDVSMLFNKTYDDRLQASFEGYMDDNPELSLDTQLRLSKQFWEDFNREEGEGGAGGEGGEDDAAT